MKGSPAFFAKKIRSFNHIFGISIGIFFALIGSDGQHE